LHKGGAHETVSYSRNLAAALALISGDIPGRSQGKLILPCAPAPQGTRTLVVTIVKFDPDPSDEVKLHEGGCCFRHAGLGACC
ncbi:MAG: hypothetical protein ACREF8_03575, partial [Chthoniobacterales bacterium]